jgi:hypothetical protein
MDGRMAGYSIARRENWVDGTAFVLGVDTISLLCVEYHEIDCSHQWQTWICYFEVRRMDEIQATSKFLYQLIGR